MSSKPQLVQKRECGECSACCIILNINQPDFKKNADTECSKMNPSGGCQIYSERPDVCRNWFCVWRYMEQFGKEWRPDQCGFILRWHNPGVIMQPIREPIEVLTSLQALQMVGMAIENGLPISISVPTKIGFCNAIIQLHEKEFMHITRSPLRLKEEMQKRAEYASNAETDPDPEYIQLN